MVVLRSLSGSALVVLAGTLGACATSATEPSSSTASTASATSANGGSSSSSSATSATSPGDTESTTISDPASGTVGAIPDPTPDASSPSPTTCATRIAGFFAGKTISAAGETRRYDLYVPDGSDLDAKLPVVFVFHADDGQSLRTILGLEAVTGTKAIVVYPYGNGGSWSFAKPDVNDDYAFVDALKASIASTQCADTARTFAFGFSNGAYFVNQMACYRGTATFRGIAVNSGGLFAPDGAPDTYDESGALNCPAPPPGVLLIHGTADSASNGGVDYTSQGLDALNSWKHNDACGTSSAATSPSPCVTYSCTKNPVEWCSIPGMGHQVWSNAALASWSFFSGL